MADLQSFQTTVKEVKKKEVGEKGPFAKFGGSDGKTYNTKIDHVYDLVVEGKTLKGQFEIVSGEYDGKPYESRYILTAEEISSAQGATGQGPTGTAQYRKPEEINRTSALEVAAQVPEIALHMMASGVASDWETAVRMARVAIMKTADAFYETLVWDSRNANADFDKAATPPPDYDDDIPF